MSWIFIKNLNLFFIFWIFNYPFFFTKKNIIKNNLKEKIYLKKIQKKSIKLVLLQWTDKKIITKTKIQKKNALKLLLGYYKKNQKIVIF